jgi:hypothetical protein
MLQMFYLDVTYICNSFKVFFRCFLQVFQKPISSVLSVFKYMLQVLHLYVLKVDRVLHWEGGGGARDPHTQSTCAGNVRAAWARVGVRNAGVHGKQSASRASVRRNFRALALQNNLSWTWPLDERHDTAHGKIRRFLNNCLIARIFFLSMV